MLDIIFHIVTSTLEIAFVAFFAFIVIAIPISQAHDYNKFRREHGHFD